MSRRLHGPCFLFYTVDRVRTCSTRQSANIHRHSLALGKHYSQMYEAYVQYSLSRLLAGPAVSTIAHLIACLAGDSAISCYKDNDIIDYTNTLSRSDILDRIYVSSRNG